MGDRAHGSGGDLKQWQRRIFWSIWVTYFAYYLCRYNMPVAKTTLCQTYSWDAEQFGIILSALTLMYALGQFVNGQLADRFGSRLIASLGVLGSVVMNLAVFVLLLVATPDGADPRRELLEETGYEAVRLELLDEGPTSAGLTNEVLTFFLARSCRRVADGGGDETEDIEVHVVPLDQADAWLEGKRAGGVLLDPQIYAAMYLAQRHVASAE